MVNGIYVRKEIEIEKLEEAASVILQFSHENEEFRKRYESDDITEIVIEKLIVGQWKYLEKETKQYLEEANKKISEDKKSRSRNNGVFSNNQRRRNAFKKR